MCVGTRLEVVLQVLQEIALIAFDDEVIVSEARAHEAGDGALSQQGIGGEVFVLEVEPLEQRDGGFDLVGLFERVRIARYGQQADFFWA